MTYYLNTEKTFGMLTFLLLFLNISIAQVGIGTTSPSAMLEVVSTDTGIPTLELTPQSAPVGDTTGQLAVIGDILYMYDATRGKWLSVESTALQFSKDGDDIDGEYLNFGGDVADRSSGAFMPNNGTITAISIMAEDGQSDKAFQIRINGTTDTTYNLSSLSFSQTDIDIEFDSEDFINVRVVSSGDEMENPTAIIWVKWRK